MGWDDEKDLWYIHNPWRKTEGVKKGTKVRMSSNTTESKYQSDHSDPYIYRALALKPNNCTDEYGVKDLDVNATKWSNNNIHSINLTTLDRYFPISTPS